MEKRQIGDSDLHINPVVFGGNVFGWTIDQKQSFEILDYFVNAGFNAIDTADVYSRWGKDNVGGESETIIGNWLKERKNRENVVLMTKVGSDMGDGKKGLRKEYIIKAAEASLKRLQTDYIDLYQTHFDDESVPIQETLEAYDKLQKDGKIRWIGTSNMAVDRLKESLQVSAENQLPVYQSLQPHYNLYARSNFEDGLEPITLGHKLGVITYYSLESGFLTGKYRTKEDLSKSPRGADMDKYFDDRGFKILEALNYVANEYKTTPAAVALAWLIKRPSVTAPIVSATSIEQMKSIIQAPELDLDANALGMLTTASAW